MFDLVYGSQVTVPHRAKLFKKFYDLRPIGFVSISNRHLRSPIGLVGRGSRWDHVGYTFQGGRVRRFWIFVHIRKWGPLIRRGRPGIAKDIDRIRECLGGEVINHLYIRKGGRDSRTFADPDGFVRHVRDEDVKGAVS